MDICARRLSIGYSAQYPVMQDIDLHLPESCLTCLIGDNGAGKSTLLKTIAGSIKPIAGDIIIDGKPGHCYSAQQKARMFSIALTDNIGGAMITVRDVVSAGRMPYTGFLGRLSQEDSRIVDSALKIMGIEQLKRRYMSQLSDGQRQRAIIAKALAQQTPVMILDEPTAFLDYKSRIELMTMMRNLSDSGKSILMATHDIALAQKFAGWMWVIGHGNIAEGTPDDCAELLPALYRQA